MKIKRAFLIKPGRFELLEVDIVLQPDELLVKVETCGLCNWELNHWKGLIGQFPQSLGMNGQIGKITEGLMADFVIEGTGNTSLLNTAIDYLKASGRGRLILMSSYESLSKNVDFRKAIEKAIEIRVPHPSYSINQFEDMRRAVSYINKGIFKMDDLISHKFSLEEIQKAFETLGKKPKDYIKGIIIP